MLTTADLVVVGIGRSSETVVLMTCLHAEVVVESCSGEEAVEMLKMLVETLHEEILVVDVLEVTVENTGKVGEKIHSYTEVVSTGKVVESYSSKEAVTMVEVVTCGCKEVGNTGKVL